jgi:hypothetical protein
MGLPSSAGFEGCLHGDLAELHPEAFHGVPRRARIGKKGGDLRPYGFASDQPALGDCGPEGFFGTKTEGGVGAKYVQEDAGVNSGDHSRPFPRRRARASSVERPRVRIPKLSSTGSFVSAFATTRRPRSSSTSRRCPARIPKRTRRALGIVIWPFSDTTVFIPIGYEFLLNKSNGRGGGPGAFRQGRYLFRHFNVGTSENWKGAISPARLKRAVGPFPPLPEASGGKSGGVYFSSFFGTQYTSSRINSFVNPRRARRPLAFSIICGWPQR